MSGSGNTFKIVMIRHGESEWNKLNKFCGWFDANLSETGVKEAEAGGKALADAGYSFDVAHTSLLTRAQVTLAKVLEGSTRRTCRWRRLGVSMSATTGP